MLKNRYKIMTYPFYDSSGLANYINIFHKVEIQMVILSGLTFLNPNWIKGYEKNTNFFISSFLQFCKKKLRFTNGHFTTISVFFISNCIGIFYKIEVQTVIFRCLLCLNVDLIKHYNMILVKM